MRRSRRDCDKVLTSHHLSLRPFTLFPHRGPNKARVPTCIPVSTREHLWSSSGIVQVCSILLPLFPISLTSWSRSFTNLDAHLESLATDAFLPVTSTANGKGDTGKKGSTTAGANGNPKKRKAETQGSNGVKKLQRTDTTGMNKLTSFFAKGKKNEEAADKGEEAGGKEDQ